jgi:hypothetical protein
LIYRIGEHRLAPRCDERKVCEAVSRHLPAIASTQKQKQQSGNANSDCGRVAMNEEGGFLYRRLSNPRVLRVVIGILLGAIIGVGLDKFYHVPSLLTSIAVAAIAVGVGLRYHS